MAVGQQTSGAPGTRRIRAAALPPRVRAWLNALAGPGLIVVAVLVVLHDFAFGAMATSQHVDVLAIQMPWNCFLGRSLLAGHIPAWNPYSLGGAPFAADLQSGWMYLPAMLLFTVLPCARAIGWFLVLQPLIGGLGTYWFLREEKLSRVSATLGGLVLALALAGSLLGTFIAFAAITAWVPVLLAAASKCLGSPTWPRRVVWAMFTALVWGQLAAPHLPTGVFLGTTALVFYGVVRTVREVRSGRLAVSAALGLWALIFLSLPLVNLALLLPRAAYFPRTSISLGYDKLQNLTASLSGLNPKRRLIGPATVAPWPLKFATSPGMYLGAAPLAFAFAGWWSRRLRPLVAALSLYGALCYVGGLEPVVRTLARSLHSFSLADPYIHSPLRLVYGLLPAAAALAALGLEAWRDATSRAARLLMVFPGLVVWGALPILKGAHPSRMLLVAVGAAAGAAVLAVADRRAAVLALLPALVAVELGASDLIGQAATRPLHSGLPVTSVFEAPLRRPTVDAAGYLRPGPIVRALQLPGGGRYLSLDPKLLTDRGYLLAQAPDDWGLLANQRSMLFRLEEIQGYSSVQLRRYWMFVRAKTPRLLDYNAAVFPAPDAAELNLLQVGWIVGPANTPPEPNSVSVGREGQWELYRLPNLPPRASVLTAWREVGSSDEALLASTDPAFDPAREAIVEQNPGLAPASPSPPVEAAPATYSSLGLQAARVEVDAPGPAVVLVRNVFDPNWHASVDGRPTRVLPTDFLDQGIPVSPGRHTILLTYDDPWVGYGLAGSGAAVTLLMGLAVLLGRRSRIRGRLHAPAGRTPLATEARSGR